MTDYDNDPTKPITRRLRYFDNQLLRDQDFIDEQKYHLDRLRRASRSHLSPGRVEGLEVTLGDAQDPASAIVNPGAAVDRHGRWLVLDGAGVKPTNHAPQADNPLIGIRWSERQVLAQEGNNTRFDETPEVKFYGDPAALDADAAVLLATLARDNGQWLVRPAPPAGLRLPGLSDHDPPAVLRVDADGLSFTTGERRPLTVAPDANPLRVSSDWTGFANVDHPPHHAEIANDTGQYKALMIAGNHISGRRTVKIYDDLVVAAHSTLGGALKIAGDGNPLQICSNWSGFAAQDQPDNQAELANDTADHKALVIAGNRSSGRRTVKILDDLAVAADADVGGALVVHSSTSPLRLTDYWSEAAKEDQPASHAEISNDTSNSQALVIVGNRSSGRRAIKLYDEVTVFKTLFVDGIRSGGPYIDFKLLKFTGAGKQSFTVTQGLVTDASATISSFSFRFTEKDHHIKEIHAKPSVETKDSKVTVTLDISMGDGSGSETTFSADVLVFYKVGAAKS